MAKYIHSLIRAWSFTKLFGYSILFQDQMYVVYMYYNFDEKLPMANC